MKIIDLLNKIANGEEAPKEIFYKKQWWKYNPNNDYEGTDWGGCLLNNVLINELNDEVEIIEEDKEIEKIEIVNNGNMNAYAIYSANGTKCALTKHSKVMCDKINEIIDKLNEVLNDKN